MLTGITGYTMISTANLRHEIAQARVDYLWEIYRNHNLVKGCAPKISRANSDTIDGLINAYSQSAASLFPENNPEGVKVEDEIQRDLQHLDAVLRREYNPYNFSKKRLLTVRDYGVNSDDGTVDASHLAFGGILTNSVWNALVAKDYGTVKLEEEYSFIPLAQFLGIGHPSLYSNFNQAKMKLFGEYGVVNRKGYRGRGGPAVRQEEIIAMLRKINSVIPVNEVKRHISNVYNTPSNNFKAKFQRFAQNPFEFISAGDPYYTFANFQFYDLFGINTAANEYFVMDLPALNAVMNIVMRDHRILATHFGLKEAAKRLGLKNRRSVYDLVIDGEIKARSPSLLPLPIGANKDFLMCDDDLIATRERRESYYLYRWVTGSRPNPRSRIAFREDSSQFLQMREVIRIMRYEVDYTHNGISFENIDPRELEEGAIVQSFISKNREALGRIVSSAPKTLAKDLDSLLRENDFYLPAIPGLLPESKYYFKHRQYQTALYKALKKEGIIKRFGFFDVIKLSDLIGVIPIIRNFDDLMDQTVGAIEFGQLVGISKTTIYDLSRIGLLPAIRYPRPYSNAVVVRLTPGQVEYFHSYNQLLSKKDVHRIALERRILLSDRTLIKHFDAFLKAFPYQNRISDLSLNPRRYTPVYANAFLLHLQKLLGIEGPSNETKPLILPRDAERAKKINWEKLLERNPAQLGLSEQHNLALVCKTSNTNGLAAAIFVKFGERFRSVAMGKTRAKRTEIDSYANAAIWEAFQTYDLYSGESFLDHFDRFIALRFVPEMRNEFPVYNQKSLHTHIGDDKDSETLEAFIEAADEIRPDVQAEANEIRSLLKQGLSSLNDATRQVIDLYYGLTDNENSVPEISVRLGIPESQVKALLEEGIELMRKIFVY